MGDESERESEGGRDERMEGGRDEECEREGGMRVREGGRVRRTHTHTHTHTHSLVAPCGEMKGNSLALLIVSVTTVSLTGKSMTLLQK